MDAAFEKMDEAAGSEPKEEIATEAPAAKPDEDVSIEASTAELKREEKPKKFEYNPDEEPEETKYVHEGPHLELVLSETKDNRSILDIPENITVNGIVLFFEMMINKLLLMKGVRQYDQYRRVKRGKIPIWICHGPNTFWYIKNVLEFAQQILIQKVETMLMFVLKRDEREYEYYMFTAKVADVGPEREKDVVTTVCELLPISAAIEVEHKKTWTKENEEEKSRYNYALEVRLDPPVLCPIIREGFNWNMFTKSEYTHNPRSSNPLAKVESDVFWMDVVVARR